MNAAVNKTPQALLRQHYLAVRRSLSKAQQHAYAKDICAKIIGSEQYQAAQHIGVYLATQHEVDLSPLLEYAQAARKCLYLPRIQGQDIDFAPWHSTQELIANRYNILEPPPSLPSIAVHNLDIIYLPLVAFDRQMHRIGMGGGYYDRYLQHAREQQKPLRVGIAYPQQETQDCIANPWDIPLHQVITPASIFTTT